MLIRLFFLTTGFHIFIAISDRLNKRSAFHMAHFTPDTEYVPLSYSPSGTNTSSTVQLGTEAAEMASLDHRHESASRSLLRRESVKSIASNTSSQMQAQRYHILKRIVQAVSECAAQLESRVQGRMRQSHFYGWRMGLVFGSTMSAFVSCCNIIAVVVASRLGT